MRQEVTMMLGRLVVAVVAVVGAGVVQVVGAGADALPTADLSIVSQTANVRHTHVGDEVTFTIVAANNGPDAVDFNVVTDPWAVYPDRFAPSDFQLGWMDCTGPGIGGSDGPACEYFVLPPGATVTATVGSITKPTTSKYASNTACVFSWNGPITDPNPANDCMTTSVRIVGDRNG
jgi:uncharacterized repeat protein (TIGR01451 family)